MSEGRDFVVYRDGQLAALSEGQLLADIGPGTVIVVEEGAAIRDGHPIVSRRADKMLKIFRDQLRRPLSICIEANDAVGGEFSDVCAHDFVLLPQAEARKARLGPALASRMMNGTFRRLVAAASLVYVRMPSWTGAAFAEIAAQSGTPLLLSVHGNWGQAYRAIAEDSAEGLLRRAIAGVEALRTEAITRQLCQQSIANFFVGATLQRHYSPDTDKPEFTFANFLLTEADRLPVGELKARLSGPTSNPFRLIFVGAFASRKGLAQLLQAAEKAYGEGLDLEVLLVGEGELANRLSDFAPRLSSGTRIKNFGYVPYGQELFRIYRQADAFVLPSVGGEGVPKVVAEAMAQGLPVIATDVGSTGELVQDDVTGLLISPGSTEALIQAISTLARDHERRRRLALAGWEASKSMTNDVQRRRVWEALRQVAQGCTRDEAVV